MNRCLLPVAGLLLASVALSQSNEVPGGHEIEGLSQQWTNSGLSYTLAAIPTYEKKLGSSLFAGHGFVTGVTTVDSYLLAGYRGYVGIEVGGFARLELSLFGVISNNADFNRGKGYDGGFSAGFSFNVGG